MSRVDLYRANKHRELELALNIPASDADDVSEYSIAYSLYTGGCKHTYSITDEVPHGSEDKPVFPSSAPTACFPYLCFMSPRYMFMLPSIYPLLPGVVLLHLMTLMLLHKTLTKQWSH